MLSKITIFVEYSRSLKIFSHCNLGSYRPRYFKKKKKSWKENTARIFYACRHATLRRWWVIIECHDVHQNATWWTRIPRHRFTLCRRRRPTLKTPLFRIDPFNLARPDFSRCARIKLREWKSVSPLRLSVSRVLRNFFSLSHERTFS